MTKALIDLATFYDWSYVSIVYSEGPYGENGLVAPDSFMTKAL